MSPKKEGAEAPVASANTGKIRRSAKPKLKPRGKPFPKGVVPKTAWKKGQSGNKKGRPPLPKEVKDAFDVLSTEATNVLREIIHNPKHPRREQACEYAINRANGTPPSASSIQVKVEASNAPNPVAAMLDAMISRTTAEPGKDPVAGGGDAGKAVAEEAAEAKPGG